MAKIYSLETGGVIWYVGSTVRALHTREIEHRSNPRSGGSRIPKEFEWTIKQLETCSTENRLVREQYWYDTLNPLVNNQRPNGESYRTEYKREWRKNNPEKAKAAKQRYRASLRRTHEIGVQTENIGAL